MIIKLETDRKEHVCSYCNSLFFWGKESQWFGKLESKNGKINVEFKACSIECKQRLIEEKGLPN